MSENDLKDKSVNAKITSQVFSDLKVAVQFYPWCKFYLFIFLLLGTVIYSGIPISRTSRGNANWFEKSGVREIEGGIKLRLIGRVLFDYE